MRVLLTALLIIFGTQVASAQSIDLYVVMMIRMDLRYNINNPEHLKQWDTGQGFSTEKSCENYLISEVLSSDYVLERKKHTNELVVNSYWDDKTTIIQQWRCVKMFVFTTN